MATNRFRARSRAGWAMPALAALTMAAVTALPWSDGHAGTTPTYSIDFHRISSGGSALRSHCYRLAGSVGQAAPGYSSGSTISIVGGFWLAAPIEDQDQMFFNGFEGC